MIFVAFAGNVCVLFVCFKVWQKLIYWIKTSVSVLMLRDRDLLGLGLDLVTDI